MGNNETSGGNAKGKWILFAIVVAIAVGAYHFWLSPEVRSENYYKEGEEIIKNREYKYIYKTEEKEAAIAAYTKAIDLNPKNSKAFAARAIIRYHCQEYDKAFADCEKAIELDPRNSDAYWVRGEAYYEGKKDKEKALADFNQAIALNPQNVEARKHRAYFYDLNLKDYENAIADYTAVIKNKNADVYDKADAYSCRGGIYEQQGNLISAIENFTKALEMRENSLDYRSRGDCYKKQGDYKQAVVDYTKAIELSPEVFLTYFHRSEAYRLLGNTTQAEADIAKAQTLMEKKLEKK